MSYFDETALAPEEEERVWAGWSDILLRVE